MKVLTTEADNDRAEFIRHWGHDGCSCHLSPPCNYCLHPGNPLNQEEDALCWEEMTPCFHCDGTCDSILEQYEVNLPNNEKFLIHELLIIRCIKCKEESIPPESSRILDKTIDEWYKFKLFEWM